MTDIILHAQVFKTKIYHFMTFIHISSLILFTLFVNYFVVIGIIKKYMFVKKYKTQGTLVTEK